MSTDTTGGPAFPHLHIAACEGMTLRDYFAAQAMSGQLAFSPGDEFDKYHKPDDVAAFAYRQADAMLKERAK